MIWKIRKLIYDARWSLASWLIGMNTRRAIYFGPEAMTITWESDRIELQTIMGAKAGLFMSDNGKMQTVFSASKKEMSDEN